MNKALIENYNEKVGPEDTCYILGDLTMLGKGEEAAIRKFVEQMTGRKVLILGNHDKCHAFAYCEMGFDSVHTMLPLNMPPITLVHDPAACCIRPGKYLVGHVHNLFKEFKTNTVHAINVGVDVWNYCPVDLDSLLAIFVPREDN